MRARCGGRIVAVLALLVGCASGGGSDDDVTMRRDSGPSSRCDPACMSPEICVAGACVDPGVDADMDGIPASQDCDDTNGAVGRMAERTCDGECGSGVQQCAEGVWGSCSAPTVCDCMDGDPPREIACPGCGTQRQVCMDGVWVDDGSCVTMGDGCTPGETRGGASCGMCGTSSEICDLSCSWQAGACEGETGECMPGEIDEQMESCGGCGDGTRTRTHSCGAGCTWGEWGGWGTCSTGTGSGVCTPGMTDTETRGCGNCGTETRTRSCNDSCDWNAWGAWSGCSGEGVCAPGATDDCLAPRDVSTCVHRVCTSSCTWGGCQLKPGNVCDHWTDGGAAGSRWQCCGSNAWQYCSRDTCDWFPCQDCGSSCSC